jgi:hypothetical protein
MKNNQAATICAQVLAAMEQGALLNEIQPLLKSLAEIGHIDDCTDDFGLTISMRAAALGNLEVVKAAHELGASLELRNKLTNANLLHYAAQQPQGGAAVIKWVILDQKASDALLNQQILLPGKDRREEDKNWDRGNGHTVAFEAVFNNNVRVIEALIEIENQGHKVDFTTPAVHGRSTLGWALKRNANAIVELLGKKLHPNLTNPDAWKEDSATRKEYAEKEDSATREYAKKKDEEWRSSHPQDYRALDLAQELRRYIVDGSTQKQRVKNLLNLEFNDVEPNKPYGRFGQPLLILVPTHPDIMNLNWNDDRRDRYTDVVKMLIDDRDADPTTLEKGLMEVNAGFREVFFGPMGALEIIIERVDSSARADFLNKIGLFNGYTRLIDAALIGRKEAIKLLLKYDPNRRIKGFNGWTACAAAGIYNNAEVNPEQRIPEEVLTHLCDGQERRGLPKDSGETAYRS